MSQGLCAFAWFTGPTLYVASIVCTCLGPTLCVEQVGVDLCALVPSHLACLPDSSSANEEDERPLQEVEKEAPALTSSPNTTVCNHV